MNSNKYTQSTLNITFDFGNTNNDLTFDTLNTDTHGHANFTLNPHYSCRCRRGYSLSSDPHNTWKRQTEPADYSRIDIARAYRIGLRSGF